jgi:predicted metal-dependent hydrolase
VLPEQQKTPDEVIEKHEDWIHEKNKLIQIALEKSKQKKLVDRSEDEFKQLAKSITQNYAGESNFPLNHVYFRKMNSKWGSCSKKKNMTLNTVMKHLPQKLIEYVIFHELIHLKEKRHNQYFWKAISEKFPDYEEKEKDLLIYWFLIQNRQN